MQQQKQKQTHKQKQKQKQERPRNAQEQALVQVHSRPHAQEPALVQGLLHAQDEPGLE